MGGRRSGSCVAVRTVVYLNGAVPIAQDAHCSGSSNVPAGQTVWLICLLGPVTGVTQIASITGVEFL
jgi:hypothetical protein